MKSLLKILKSNVILLLVILFATSCSSSIQSVNSNRITKASTIVKCNDYIYYYNLSHDGKQGLFQYNTKTKENKEIDSFIFYGDLFLIGNDIYYLCGDDSKTFHVRCYNGVDIVDKGIINDDLIRASGLRYVSEECQVFVDSNVLYVFYKDKIYMNKDNNQFEMIAKNISTFAVDDNDIYYSDDEGSLYYVSGQNHSVIINHSEFNDISYVNKTLGNYYKVTNLNKCDDNLYFLIRNKDSNGGKCFRVSLKNHNIEQVFEEGATGRICIQNGILYYYDVVNSNIVCKDCNSNNAEVINVPKNFYGFDVIEDVIYYSVINPDGKSLTYFKFQNGEEIELFQQ